MKGAFCVNIALYAVSNSKNETQYFRYFLNPKSYLKMILVLKEPRNTDFCNLNKR